MSNESTPDAQQPSEMELLRAEMRAGFASIDKRFDGVDTRLDGIDGRLDGIDGRLDGHDNRFVALERHIAQEEATTRRHFDVVAEGLRSDLKVVIDGNVATAEKLDRLIVTNSIEHAAFLEAITDHEVRITRLERNSAPSTRAKS